MKIKHQGFFEVQPTYQHVGYISAASYRPALNKGTGSLAMAFFTLGVVFSLYASRNATQTRRSAGTLLKLMAGIFLIGGVAMFLHGGVAYEKYYPEQRANSITQYHLKHQIIQLDMLALMNPDKLPATCDWAWSQSRQKGDIQDNGCDAWGTRLRYRWLSHRGPDGRMYEVFSAGPDGRFFTVDDVRLPADRLRRLIDDASTNAVFATRGLLEQKVMHLDLESDRNGGNLPLACDWAWSSERPRGEGQGRDCDMWGNRLRYHRLTRRGPDGRLYEVFSAGPDGLFLTEDDVRLALEDLIRLRKSPER